MLTVKQVKYTGEENIFEAVDVNFIPEVVRKGYPSVQIELPDGSGGLEIASGICYVMNESGSTIARYKLSRDGSESVEPKET